jgi:tetratricopeptide repeat protein 21B
LKTATHHVEKLIEKQPSNYKCLARLVELLRRSGRLEEGWKFARQADQTHMRVRHEAGYHYILGLLHRYENDMAKALTEFNRARGDVEWGFLAHVAMIEIYLSIDSLSLWREAQENERVVSVENIRSAMDLLQEVSTTLDAKTYGVLQAYVRLGTGTKRDVEIGISEFAQILRKDPEHVAASVGLATGHVLLKQIPKARNSLKRIVKKEYMTVDAEAFERGFLLLADIYIKVLHTHTFKNHPFYPVIFFFFIIRSSQHPVYLILPCDYYDLT